MTKEDFIASFKYSVLQYAYKHKNITILVESLTYLERSTTSG